MSFLNNNALTFFFIIFWLLIFVQRIVEIFAQRKIIRGVIKQRWTLTIMVILHLFIFFGSIFEYFLIQRSINLIITIIGLSLYFFGLFLRNYAIRTLKQFWSLHVEIREDHLLVRAGPYQYIRHPAYLAIICEISGIPLVVNAYLVFFTGILLYISIILKRISCEEEELIRKFNNDYKLYKKEVSCLLPINYLKGLFSKKQKI